MKNTLPPTDIPTPLRREHMGDITLKQVRCFLVASHWTTFKQAAEESFLSQPAFCRIIQELESSVGQELFTRTNQGIKLSGAGQAFLPHAQRLIDCYSATLTGMTKWRSAGHSQFVLAGIYTIMPVILPSLLSSLQENFATPSLQFEDGNSQQVIASVLQGRADCGLCTVLTEHPELYRVPLLEAPLGLLVSPSLPLPDNIQTLAELKGINIARYDGDAAVSQLLHLNSIEFDAYYTSRVVYSNISAVYAMVQTGQVAAVVSGIAASHPQAKGLRFIPLPTTLPSLTLSLITKRAAPFDAQRTLMKDLTQACVLAAKWHNTVHAYRPQDTDAEGESS